MKKQTISLESIEFQDKTRAYDLQLLLSKLRNSPYNSKQSQTSKELKDVQDFILKRFGLNVNIVTDTNILAAITLPILSSDHIFFFDFKEHLEKEVSKLYKDLGNDGQTTISLKEAKITGLFSSIKLTMYLSWGSILKNKRLSDEEITAITLHELGHGYTTFEYCFRLIQTNQALSTIANNILNKQPEKYLINLKYIGKSFFKDENKFDDVKNIDNPDVVISYIASTIIKESKTETGILFYDKTTCEYLADQFVARNRYGIHLATALNKVSRSYSLASATFFTTIRIFIEIISALFIPVGTLIIFILLVFDSVLTLQNFTYDKLKVRYKRISEQMIQDLKHQKYSNEVLLEKIKEIEVIQNLIDNTYEFRGIFERLITFMLPSERNANTAMKLQRDLEELASNNLFVQSAKFKLLQS